MIIEEKLKEYSINKPLSSIILPDIPFVNEKLFYKNWSFDDELYVPLLDEIKKIGEVLKMFSDEEIDNELLHFDARIKEHKLFWGDTESLFLSRLQSLPMLNKDSIIVDVGGHIGHYSAFFKDFIGCKKVYYFEMNKQAYNLVKYRYKDDPSIEVENYAVCDKNEEMVYYRQESSYMNTLLSGTSSTCTVPGIRLDSYFKDEKIDLVKLDVEGVEIKSLQGMKGIIKNIRFLLVECHDKEDWNTLRDLLLNEYNMDCINLETLDPVTNDTKKKPYQCFCKNKTFANNFFDFNIFMKKEGGSLSIPEEYAKNAGAYDVFVKPDTKIIKST